MSRARLHGELTGFLRQYCPARDQRHLVLLGWIVAGLLLSETVCTGHWKTRLPLGHCLAASWQRWLSNVRIDPESLYGPLQGCLKVNLDSVFGNLNSAERQHAFDVVSQFA